MAHGVDIGVLPPVIAVDAAQGRLIGLMGAKVMGRAGGTLAGGRGRGGGVLGPHLVPPPIEGRIGAGINRAVGASMGVGCNASLCPSIRACSMRLSP